MASVAATKNQPRTQEAIMRIRKATLEEVAEMLGLYVDGLPPVLIPFLLLSIFGPALVMATLATATVIEIDEEEATLQSDLWGRN